MDKIIMQKIKVLWQCVRACMKACVKACVNWVWQNWLSILLVMVGVALFAMLFLVMFDECVEYWVKMALGVGRKRDAVQFIGLGIAGVVAIAGAVAVNRRAMAQIENNKLIEIGHIQERFKAAVEHLGSEQPTARIASFYEFSYLARDNENLRTNIFDILCAHLRQTTTDKGYKEKIGFTEGEKNLEVRHAEEVQSLLDLLFQEDSIGELVFVESKPKLRGIFLVRASLYMAHLQIADLRAADLRGADLRGAGLQGAYLQSANLENGILEEANLESVNLFQANLQDANLMFAILTDVILDEANVRGADFLGADLRGVDFRKVKNLDTAILNEAKIKGAKFPKGYKPPEDVDDD